MTLTPEQLAEVRNQLQIITLAADAIWEDVLADWLPRAKANEIKKALVEIRELLRED